MNISQGMTRLIDAIIPDAVKRTARAKNQARVFVFAHIFGPFIGLTVPLFLVYIDPQPGIEILVISLGIAGFWIYPLLLALFPLALTPIVLAAGVHYTLLIVWGIFHYGGFQSPLLVWLIVIPQMTFLFLGPGSFSKQFGICMSAGGIGLLIFLHQTVRFPSRVDPELLIAPSAVSAIAVVIHVYLSSQYHSELIDDRSELLAEVRRHEETLRKLTVAKETAETERALALEAKIDAERANQAKTAFLTRMSHELRTPLNAVLGYSELLIEDTSTPRSEQEIHDIQRITAAGMHLLAMVNDILDISKIEAGAINLYAEHVDLDRLMAEVAGTVLPMVQKNGNRLLVSSQDLGSIRGDGTKIRQAILNLLGNAAKFTKNGTITLSTRSYVMDSESWIDIAVSDTGIGISAEDQSRLFTNFTQANRSIGLIYGGSGLGLSLSQNLCRLMGGSISLRSAPDQGSTFTIHLPIDRAHGPASIEPSEPLIFHPEGRRPFNRHAHTLTFDEEQQHQDQVTSPGEIQKDITEHLRTTFVHKKSRHTNG